MLFFCYSVFWKQHK